MLRRRRLLLWLWLALCQTGPAWAADPVVALRVGNHDGFGRIALDLPPGAQAEVTEQDGALTVQLAGVMVQPPRATPRNLAGLSVQPGQLRLTLAPGAGWRRVAAAGKLVIDLLDNPAAPPPRRPRTWSGPPPRPRSPPAIAAAVAPPPPPAAKPDPPPVALAPSAPPALAPASPSASPPAAASAEQAGPVALGATVAGASLCLPFAAGTGAAALRRGATVLVVFDERRPVDLAALHGEALFDAARVQVLPAATVVSLPLPADRTVHLARAEGCWMLTEAPAEGAPPPAPIRAEAAAGRLLLTADAAGRVVSVPDPDSGAALLVGTQTKPGQAVALARRTPEFALLASLQGVAIEPLSDGLALHAETPGFVLEDDGGRPLALAPLDAGGVAALAAARLTRRWDFPGLSQAALERRLQAATAAAAEAPAQSRSAGRLAAVQAQLALGLGAEAEALATLARSDDARIANSPDAAALGAVAALLAGRTDEAAALDDPNVGGSDEVALWRAARRAWQTEGAPDAAAVFAATAPLLAAYPAALRQRLLPLAGETMALGGERAAAHRLLDAHKDDPSLDFARALLDEVEGHAAASLAVLDRLAQSPDRNLRVRAAVRAVEQRLRIGELKPAAAADALDRLIYAWRGDGRELSLRLRVAELRAQAGDWRAALALLRETADSDLAKITPDAGERIRARMAANFSDALAQDARAPLPPLELVGLVEENPDLLPAGAAGQDLAARLANRLAALDLPKRAVAVLAKLMAATTAGPARAEVGAGLADLQLDQNDPTAALDALSDSATTDLPTDLDQRRTIAFARATASLGHVPEALAALAAIDTPAADEARAHIAEAAQDWPRAAATLAGLAARIVPPEGPLDDSQAKLLLRLATAAAQAHDEALLAALRQHDVPRLPPGKLADMVRLLTEAPVSGVADLPRAAHEAALARNFTADLASLAPRPASP